MDPIQKASLFGLDLVDYLVVLAVVLFVFGWSPVSALVDRLRHRRKED